MRKPVLIVAVSALLLMNLVAATWWPAFAQQLT